MSGPESKTIVVRAWRDRGRLIIRVLTGTGDLGSGQEWVFADIDASLAHIGELLGELRTDAASDETKR
ncbi:hypothetical protein F3087_43705 [Nocardia colli]|uniref:Uncharacterized protein n=1 Tax=Nocardia colli TaxID=2545717 RepID=A0A5N0DRH9_9NOCA|nr:hypothetical protein [Nocardia colli]KAA8879667.1 hypothetical protein F3087_43705 [Nocardia colli]